MGRLGDCYDPLNDLGRSLKEAKILIIGLANNPNADHDRGAPAYEITSLIKQRGAVVGHKGPQLPAIRPRRSPGEVPGPESHPISVDSDMLMLCTSCRANAGMNLAKLSERHVDYRVADRTRPPRFCQA